MGIFYWNKKGERLKSWVLIFSVFSAIYLNTFVSNQSNSLNNIENWLNSKQFELQRHSRTYFLKRTCAGKQK